MKRLISLGFVIIILTMSLPVFAASDILSVKLEGKVYKFPDAKPYLLKDGTPMIPIAPIAKSMGFGVKMTGAKTVEVSKGKNISTFDVGDNKAKINGVVKRFDVKTIVKNGRTYVTPQYIKELLNSTCDWFSTSKVAIIYSSEKGEASIYQRLYDSDEYELSDNKKTYVFGSSLKPKDKRFDYHIFVSKDYLEKDEMSIRVYSYDKNTRNKINEIFIMAYPKTYKDAYNQFIATLREEVFKISDDVLNHSGIRDIYYDNRHLGIFKEIYGHKWVDISIGLKDYKYVPSDKITGQAPPAHSSYYLSDIKKYEIYYEK